ncbi:MAG: hypothetical protein ACI4I9_08990 [Porcipelethomonas sp.]
MEDILNNIDSLADSAASYEAVEAEEESRFGKKAIRRIESVSESLDGFGERQNGFNRAAAEALKELLEYCRQLEKKLETEREACRKTAAALSAVKKELDGVRLRSTLNTNQIEKLDSALVKSSERMENFILETNPGSRHSVHLKGCREADLAANRSFYEKTEELRSAADDERPELLKKLERSCAGTAVKEFSALDAYDEINIIFFGKGAFAESLFKNLDLGSVYRVSRSESEQTDGKYFVCCCETLNFPESVSFKSGLVVISGDDPLLGLTDSDVENLLFLNDCGLHEYVVMSAGALGIMKKAGFRNVRPEHPDFLSGTGIIGLVENAVENAVPEGAVSFGLFREKALGAGLDPSMGFEELRKFYSENPGISVSFEHECLSAAEKGTVSAVCSGRFPGRSIRQGTVASEENEKYDVVTGFGYVNHLKYSERKKLYERVKGMLSEEGVFIFSAKSSRTGIKLRAAEGWKGFEMYEALWTKNQLVRELEENGFRLCYLVNTGAGIYERLPAKYKSETLMWIVGVTL